MAWPKISLTLAHKPSSAPSRMLDLLLFHELAARGPSSVKECGETGGSWTAVVVVGGRPGWAPQAEIKRDPVVRQHVRIRSNVPQEMFVASNPSKINKGKQNSASLA